MNRIFFAILVLSFFALTKARSPPGCSNAVNICPSGLICKEGKCIFDLKPVFCKSQSQCISGYFCLKGICIPLGPTKWTQNYVKYINGLQADLMRNNEK